MPRWAPGRRAWTFWGWTPGIERLVAGKVLACGCLIGGYDTRTGQRVEIVDAKALNCHNSGHVPNLVLHVNTRSKGTAGRPSQPAQLPTSRVHTSVGATALATDTKSGTFGNPSQGIRHG